MTVTSESIDVVACRNEAHWHEERAKGIGGSECPILLGVSPYDSPYTLWQRRRNAQATETTEYMLAGKFLESGNAEWYAHAHPERKVLLPQVYYDKLDAWAVILRHRNYPWLQCTPDRIVIDPVKGAGVLQLKNVTEWSNEKWSRDEPPLEVQAQVQHEMLVTGLPWGAVGAVVGGNKRRDTDVVPHPKLRDKIVRIAGEFWHSLQDGSVPRLDKSESTHAALRAEYQHSDPNVQVPISAGLVMAYKAAQAEVKEAEDELRSAKSALMAAIGNAEIGTVDGIPCVSWKTSTRREKARPAREVDVRTMLLLKGGKALGQ